MSILSSNQRIDKKQIAAMAIFAMKHVPAVDKLTLNKFLELMNTTGSFGSITPDQFIRLLTWMQRNLPDIDRPSLLVLAELLGVFFPLMVKDDRLLPFPHTRSSPPQFTERFRSIADRLGGGCQL